MDRKILYYVMLHTDEFTSQHREFKNGLTILEVEKYDVGIKPTKVLISPDRHYMYINVPFRTKNPGANAYETVKIIFENFESIVY